MAEKKKMIYPDGTCFDCKIEMELKGDIRYEDVYLECPKCHAIKLTVIYY